MQHWSDAYIGLPYAQADCAELAARVQREVFGRDIRLPAERAGGLRGLTAQIDAAREDYARRVVEPQEGDGVLMVSRGRLEHVGVYCVIGPMPYVLHAMRNAGQACRHRFCDLPHLGLSVEGFYRWI